MADLEVDYTLADAGYDPKGNIAVMG